MMSAFKKVIADYVTPSGLSLQRDLTHHISHQVNYLTKTRSLSASMKTAIRYLKTQVTNLSLDTPDADAIIDLCEKIDDFIRDRIILAGQAINTLIFNAGKIKNGDVIVVYARSSVVLGLLKEAVVRKILFRVIVLDSKPFFEG